MTYNKIKATFPFLFFFLALLFSPNFSLNAQAEEEKLDIGGYIMGPFRPSLFVTRKD